MADVVLCFIYYPHSVMLPFLVASIVSEKGYPYYFKMARIWAKFILFGMGFYYKIEKPGIGT
jgi:1-acyl-sn-glycerol-3-phosphate acyltransferase